LKTTTLGRVAVFMFSLATVLTVFLDSVAHAQPAKPNILVIMGDDIGYPALRSVRARAARGG
jgi:hypothetical protein